MRYVITLDQKANQITISTLTFWVAGNNNGRYVLPNQPKDNIFNDRFKHIDAQ